MRNNKSNTICINNDLHSHVVAIHEPTIMSSKHTCTTFELDYEDIKYIRIKVSLVTSTFHTVYKYFIDIKYKHKRKFEHYSEDELHPLVTKDMLYQALFNHWQERNPIKLFSASQTNNVLDSFTVDRISDNETITVKRATVSTY